MWTWKDSPGLMKELSDVQNKLALQGRPQDIMTWAAFCESEDELRAHVERNRSLVKTHH